MKKKINVEGSCFNIGQGYSKFITLDGEEVFLTAKINPFGIKNHADRIKKNIFGKIKENQKNLLFYSKTANPSLNGFLTGISTIIIGKDIWGDEKGFELGQVKKYKKLTVSTSWDFEVKKGHADFIYDIWLNKSRTGKCQTNDVEIMVWLDRNFDVPWKEIGKFDDFSVKYEKKTKKKHPHDPGNTFAFIPNRKLKMLDFDYMKMIKFCENFLKRKLSDYWIRSIYLGTEFSNNTEVKVKLKKLNLEFEEKKIKKYLNFTLVK